jgi:hypothetical protein
VTRSPQPEKGFEALLGFTPSKTVAVKLDD